MTEDELKARIAELELEVLRLGTRANLFELREKQATEMCTWLTAENQRLRGSIKQG